MLLWDILERREKLKMGMSHRIFLIEEDNSLKRLPSTHFRRLLRREPKASLLKFAGKRVRCVEVLLDVTNRRPSRIVHINYDKIPFDAYGQIDPEWERLLFNQIDFGGSRSRNGKVIHAEHDFAKRRFDHEFRWKPSRKIEKAIEDVIFGPTRKPL